MMLLRLLPITFALLYILLQRVDVKVTKRDTLTVKINFNIIALVLHEEKINKQRLKQLSGLLKNASSALKTLKYLISKSDVAVKIYDIPYESSDPITIIKNAGIKASSRLFFSYLGICSRSLNIITAEENFDDNSDPNMPGFDASLHFPLYHLIISALFFLYYIVKNKVKRVIKNV